MDGKLPDPLTPRPSPFPLENPTPPVPSDCAKGLGDQFWENGPGLLTLLFHWPLLAGPVGHFSGVTPWDFIFSRYFSGFFLNSSSQPLQQK